MPPGDKKLSNRLEQIQVLVLDGSAHAADLLREVFVKLGFSNIHVVNDGYEGIQAMKRKTVHLVFTDWELRVRKKRLLGDETTPPKDKDVLPLSGTEFVKRLRQSPHSPNPFVPVVMVVNQEAGEHSAKARDAGVNEIVTKPLQADDLCRRIISLIDDTRHFITADTYKGPCRRTPGKPLPPGLPERRTRQVRLVRRKEFKSV
jgi:two-component system, chemotaxis family, chemotaxis protein CheY